MVIARKYSLDCSGSSETTPPPEPAEPGAAADGDAKQEGEDVPPGEEPAASAENETVQDEAPQEPPAEGAEAESEKANEPAEPPAEDSGPKPSDEGGNNGNEHCIVHDHRDTNDWQTKIFQNVTLKQDLTR